MLLQGGIAQVAGTLNTYSSYLMPYLHITLHHAMPQWCSPACCRLLMAEQAPHLPALGRLSWASSQKAVCQLTQGFPWTGIRKPLCTLSIWSTLKEPYGSQTPRSDKQLHHGKKVAISIFQRGEDEWYIQTARRHTSITSHTPAPLSAPHSPLQQHSMPPFQGLPAHIPWLPSHVGLLLCPRCC